MLIMDSRLPLMTLVFASLGFSLAFFSNFVESQENRPLPRPSPPLPPPQTPPPPSPPHPPPPVLRSPPPRNHPPPRSPHKGNSDSLASEHRAGTRRKSLNLNMGKKIGLLFVGMVLILQIGVVGFLGFKRRQLLKI